MGRSLLCWSGAERDRATKESSCSPAVESLRFRDDFVSTLVATEDIPIERADPNGEDK